MPRKVVPKSDPIFFSFMSGLIKDTFARKAKGSVDARMDVVRAEILEKGFLVHQLEYSLCVKGVKIFFTVSHTDGRHAITRKKEGILIQYKWSQLHAVASQQSNRRNLARSLRSRARRIIAIPVGWE